MKQRYFRPLFVKEIRPIVQQVTKRLAVGFFFCLFLPQIHKIDPNLVFKKRKQLFVNFSACQCTGAPENHWADPRGHQVGERHARQP